MSMLNNELEYELNDKSYKMCVNNLLKFDFHITTLC